MVVVGTEGTSRNEWLRAQRLVAGPTGPGRSRDRQPRQQRKAAPPTEADGLALVVGAHPARGLAAGLDSDEAERTAACEGRSGAEGAEAAERCHDGTGHGDAELECDGLLEADFEGLVVDLLGVGVGLGTPSGVSRGKVSVAPGP